MTSTVYIAKTVYGGDGLGRLGDGRVVFVPGAWTGEQVKAEIVEERRQFVRARLVEVVEPSPDRLSPPETAVPGMVYASLSLAGECAAKKAQLEETLSRAHLEAPAVVVEDLSACPSSHYRNKVVYHFAEERGVWAIGYREEPSHRILDIKTDPLACDEINAALPAIRQNVLRLLSTGPKVVRLSTAQKESLTIRWTKKSGIKWWLGDAPSDLVLRETTCDVDFEVAADGFYQVNPAVHEHLARAVVDAYRRGGAPDIVDLYCGVGVFGLLMYRAAPAPASLVGVEASARAIAFARKNAAHLGARAATFFAGKTIQHLKRLDLSPRTTLIVDPPRGGFERGVAEFLAAHPVGRLLYVSCDPATLARDLRTLARTYEIESVRLFNLFPRTARFETLAVLRPRLHEGDVK